MKLQAVLFLNISFQILRLETGGAAYLRMRLIHRLLRYFIILSHLAIKMPSQYGLHLYAWECLQVWSDMLLSSCFFNFSIFQSQPLYSSYSGLVQ